MAIEGTFYKRRYFIGLSTDSKPTGPISPLDTFYEINLSNEITKEYLWDGTDWRLNKKTTDSIGLSAYNYIQSEEDATYKYYGFASATGWQFKRKTLATGIWKIVAGLGSYDTAWADKENKTYGYA